ncbi:hypothetical protein BC826DRAFT_561424 [Russula brevipes]|nr:hypothetical protein BC826DRAFT_561424 [Russula brevipes]
MQESPKKQKKRQETNDMKALPSAADAAVLPFPPLPCCPSVRPSSELRGSEETDFSLACFNFPCSDDCWDETARNGAIYGRSPIEAGPVQLNPPSNQGRQSTPSPIESGGLELQNLENAIWAEFVNFGYTPVPARGLPHDILCQGMLYWQSTKSTTVDDINDINPMKRDVCPTSRIVSRPGNKNNIQFKTVIIASLRRYQ